MFSGLIAYRGKIESVHAVPGGGMTLRIRCEGAAPEKADSKDSIAINGVCLTATSVEISVSSSGDQVGGAIISFDVVPETIERSTLGDLKAGDEVNVEYSLRMGDRIGGHYVYGHVDATTKVLSKITEGQGMRFRLSRPVELAPMLTEKAFVAIDGVSVTIAQVQDDWFELAIIPETLERTTFGERQTGDAMNVEVDPLARYVHAAMQALR